MIDYKTMMTDDLHDIRKQVMTELTRRQAEPKKPVFIIDGCAYKKLDAALDALSKDIDQAKNFKDGPAIFLKDAIDNERLMFGMTVEHWSLSEYNIRPDIVWGY